MKKRLVLLFPIIFIFLLNAFGSSQKAEVFIIATGPKGAPYYKIGKYIAKLYKKYDAGTFTTMPTNGSSENIDFLKKNYADFAIVQRNVLLNNLFNEQNGINDVEVIAPLFEEKFRIYTHSKAPILISVLKDSLLKRKQRFGFISKTGYSYKFFLTVSKFLGLNPDSIKYEFSNFNQLVKDFNSGKLDYVVNFSLPMKELMEQGGVNLVYLDKKSQSLIRNRIPNLTKAFFHRNPKLRTLGSWTFFVGLKSKINRVNKPQELFASLDKNNLEKTTAQDSAINKLIWNSILKFRTGKDSNRNYVAGIPLLHSLNVAIHESQSNPKRELINYGIILLLLSLITIFIFKKWYLKWNFIKLWIRNKHVIIGVLIIIILYFLSIWILHLAEQHFYKQIGIKSQLLNFSGGQLFYWVIFRDLTGVDNGIFPMSVGGKLALSFSVYVVWIGSLFIVLAEYINSQITKKRRKGLMDINFKNHIVIIGWNDTTYDFIKNTVLTAKEYNGKSSKIVCIVSAPEEIIEKNIKVKELQALKRIYFVKGEAKDTTTLERSNIHNAYSVILLAEDNTRTSDEHTLLRAMAISKFCRSKAVLNRKKDRKVNVDYTLYETSDYIDSIYIIAEINDPSFKKQLLDSDVNEVVITSSYGKSIITQSMFNHGVSKVLDELLQFNDFNEFYIVDLSDPKHKQMQNKTFDELLLPLRKQKILLVAIKLIFHDTHNKIIIDNNEIRKRLADEGLERDMIVNPIEENEIARRTSTADQLIVFATSRKNLEKQLQQVVFE